MLDSPAPSPCAPIGNDLQRAVEISSRRLEQWDAALRDPDQAQLVAVPDLRASAEVLLGDVVLGLLDPQERDALLDTLRAGQQTNGAWTDARAAEDLTVTVLCAWALRVRGTDADKERVHRARRRVLDMGGAQRGHFSLRLWLAMAGAIPWDFVPAVPSELWLLPARLPISAHGLSARAQTYLTAFHLMASAQTRVHLGDLSDFILRDEAQRAIAPRLTRPGLAGDLMQSLDRAIKLSRKLPRQPIRRASLRRAQRLLCELQQTHGGWFSVRPTLWALMALRTQGRHSDDPVLQRGIAYIRRSRGYVGQGPNTRFVQGHSAHPLAQAIELARSLDASNLRSLILDNEIRTSGPWQRRAECRPGGWPTEVGASHHFDLWATCEALEGLYDLHAKSPDDLEISAARRRAAHTLMAMQEVDGHFALFERGETQVAIARAPWADADPLRSWPPTSSGHVVLTARALAALYRLGWRSHDDRIQRGLNYIERAFEKQDAIWPVEHLAPVLTALVTIEAGDTPLAQALDRRLRSRQREDGSFGSLHATAHALVALIRLAPQRSHPLDCAQTRRATKHVLGTLLQEPEALDRHSDPISGCALARWAVDPAGSAKIVHTALKELQRAPCAPQPESPRT